MEIIKGVYQFKIPLSGAKLNQETATSFKTRRDSFLKVVEQSMTDTMPMSHINTYLIEGEKGNLLIDTGWNTPDAYSALSSELKTAGFGFKDITHILITHVHPDHYGLAGKLKQLSGAEIAVSEIEAPFIDSRYVNPDALVQKIEEFLLSNGMPQDEAKKASKASLTVKDLVEVVKPDVLIKDGKKIVMEPFEFKVIATPGHSPGHICLYEPNRKLLFSGDHLLPEATPNIALHPQTSANPLGEFLDGLDMILDLDIHFAFPAHGPTFSGVKQIVESLFRHHEERKQAIAKAIEGSTKNAYQIAQEIPWMTDVKESSFPYLSTWNKRLAVMETLAHLEYMIGLGEAAKSVKDNITSYFA